jgi:hypothetical protein
LIGVWLVVGTGWTFANRAKATAEKVSVLLHEENPAKMAAEKRTETLNALSRQMAELPMEERLKARLDEGWKTWFASMSEDEKRRFIEATLPGGLKQMLSNFEKLPEAKRRRAISDALRDLKRLRDLTASDEQSGIRVGTNRSPALSEELQQKIVSMGLQAFYAESSAQTKAELAPILEELQRWMESGALLRGPRQ